MDAEQHTAASIEIGKARYAIGAGERLPEHLARYLLAKAESWLAANPPDDADGVTEEWLRSVGFREPASPSRRYSLQKGVVRICPPLADLGVWVGIEDEIDDIYNSVIPVPSATTRGHVRRLLAALGIPLTEPA